MLCRYLGLQRFLGGLNRHHVKQRHSPRNQKEFAIAKDLENIALTSLAVSDLGVEIKSYGKKSD